jgi:hypothetical protein
VVKKLSGIKPLDAGEAYSSLSNTVVAPTKLLLSAMSFALFSFLLVWNLLGYYFA